jgi:hypothetical protein
LKGSARDIRWEDDSLPRLFVRESSLKLGKSQFGLTFFEYFAMLPPTARVGDILSVLYGARAVMVLRQFQVSVGTILSLGLRMFTGS